MTTLLCINRKSRSGSDDCTLYADNLKQLGRVITHYLDDDSEDLSTVIDGLGEELERIVVGGGDGTLNSVLAEIQNAGVPLGVLPLGTANDFARSLNLPSDPVKALDAVLNGNTRRVGLGKANGKLFINSAGMGMGPTLTKKMDHERKQRFGVFAYLFSLVEVLALDWRAFATIYCNGMRKRTRYMQITIANGVHYGGGMTITEDADLNDGELHILCLYPQSIWQLMGKFFTLRWGGVKGQDQQAGIRFFHGEEVTVTTRRPTDVTLDGELTTSTPLHCRVIPNALEAYFIPESQSA